MQDLCELRFDISLPPGTDARRFERAWRSELAAQKMTALAMPPAQAVAARFRVCGLNERPELDAYLAARLSALPGSPAVAQEASEAATDWAGVKIWLSYRPGELTTLLQQTKQKTKKSKQSRGHRP